MYCVHWFPGKMSLEVQNTAVSKREVACVSLVPRKRHQAVETTLDPRRKSKCLYPGFQRRPLAVEDTVCILEIPQVYPGYQTKGTEG